MGDSKVAEQPKSPARKARSGPGGSLGPAPDLSSRLGDELGNARLLQLLRSGALKAKLEVSAPGDPHEREADSIADRILTSSSLSEPFGSSTPRVQRSCSSCSAEAPCAECEEEEGLVHRSAENASGAASVPAAPRLGSGRPLDHSLRSFFEPRLGRDLGDVRIHTSPEAAEAARGLHARAFTLGSDVAFADGTYAPETADGKRLLAHELTHVVQQGEGRGGASILQRDVKPGVAKGPAPPVVHPWPTVGAQVDWAGIPLTEDPRQLREQMVLLVAQGKPELGVPIQPGIGAPSDLFSRLLMGPPSCAPGMSGNDCDRAIALRNKIIPALSKVVSELHKEHEDYLAEFEKTAKARAMDTLEANKTEAQKELARYGIREETVAHTPGPPGGVPVDAGSQDYGPTWLETRKTMDQESPAGKGLQAAAGVLLKRREDLDAAIADRESHIKLKRDPDDPEHKGMIFVQDEGYAAADTNVKTQTDSYEDLREALAAEYPTLDKFARLDQDRQGLQDLATQGPGPAMAALIGQRIADTLRDIETSKEGLANPGEVNVWRLAPMVDLTRADLGVGQDLVKTTLVDEKVKSEAPGIFEGIALAVMNVAALLLAAPTGGLSLAVALGVNAAVAYQHTKEYMMQSALAGSSLRKASALSHEEPSLFWLAVEIVGVAVDAATLVQTFRALSPLARAAATAAKDSKEAEEAIKALEQAAKDHPGGAELAKKLAAKARALQAGEEASSAVRAAAKPGELKVLEAAGEAARTEAAGEALGKGVLKAGGEVKVGKAGHLFSCTSPCTILREKYAEALGKNAALDSELQRLEGLAKQAKTAEEANAVAKQAAELETKLRMEPVGWEPPLKGTPGYEEKLTRRGSAAPKLDRKPANWTGSEEAEFRALPDAPEGHHWRLDEDGELKLVRHDSAQPRQGFDPTLNEGKGGFQELADDVKQRSELIGGKTEARTLKVTEDEQKAINKLLEDRKALIKKRDDLEHIADTRQLTDAEGAELAKARAGINRASEVLGEQAAERYVSSAYPGATRVYKGSGSGKFDLIFKWKDAEGKDIFIVVEAKGGGSSLGTRQIASGARVEQGTAPYLDDITQLMVNRGEAVGSELQIARAQGRVKYLKVQAPINADPGVAIRVGEFNLATSSSAPAP